MAVQKKRGNGVDDASKAMLFEGVSISQLATLFKMDRRTVQQKLGTSIQPVGKRDSWPIYAIYDCAPLLVEHDLSLESVDQIAAYIQKLDVTRLPRLLTKEFWMAMLNKQKYEEQAGDLWRTEKVLELYGDLIKSIRTPLILAQDTVEASAELSPRQRQVLTSIIDNLLNELHDSAAKSMNQRKAVAALPDQTEDDDEL